MNNSTIVPFFDLTEQYRSIKDEVESSVQKVMASGHYVLGPNLKEFELQFADYHDAKYAVGVNSGTDALRVALSACEVKPGNEVIIPVNTFIATALAVSSIGAKVVFADHNRDTYDIDVQKIEALITNKTKAIIPVHLYGLPAQMDKILNIAQKNGLRVIEDACQAHGASYMGRKVGTWGDAGCFSFYPSKNLGAFGDAGIVITNNIDIAEKAILLRNYGQKIKYFHDVKGGNCRLDEIQAAVLKTKLKYLGQWTAKRRELAGLYFTHLKDLDIVLPREFKNAIHVYHLFVIRVRGREGLQDYLKTNNIQTLIHYPVPLHLQRAFSELKYKKGDFKVAEECVDHILSLPLYPELGEDRITFVCKKIKEFFN